MPLRSTFERSLFAIGNRLAQTRADIEHWLAEPPPSCRPLDLSELEDRVMLSASPAAQALLAEAPGAAIDDGPARDATSSIVTSQSVLLAADVPDSGDASGTDGTSAVSDDNLPEAHSQSIVIDPRDRIVGHYSIGYSANNPETRMVRSDLVQRGWENFVATQIEPALDAGFRRIMLHNPFGIPVDPETGETQVMQFEQYLAAQQEVPSLTEGFVEAWKPITDRGVEVIAYFGGPHNSPTMKALEGDMDAWWDRAWKSLQPALDAGMSIGIDNSAPRPASSPTFLLAEALRDRGVRVYVEARPQNNNPLWFDYPVVLRDPTWQITDPAISGQHPIVYSRFPRNDQLSGEILRIIRPNEEEDAQWSRMKQALMDGNSATVYAQNVFLPRRGNMNLDELLEFAGVGDVPTDIHLAASGQVGLNYTIVTAPEHGQLTVNPRNSSVVTYTPDAGFSGTDSFQFVASRGNQQSEAGTITLSVHSLLAAADPGNGPDPDQGQLVAPGLDGGPQIPPDTGPAVIPDGDGGKSLSFDPKDLPGPDEPVIAVPAKESQQAARTSSVDLQSLSSGFLPAAVRPEPTAAQPPRHLDVATPTDSAKAATRETTDVTEAIAPRKPLGHLASLGGTGGRQVPIDAPQVVNDSGSLDLRPPVAPAESTPVATAAEVANHAKSPAPAAAEPAPDTAEEPVTEAPEARVDNALPTGSVIAAALGTAAALGAAAAANSGGLLPKSKP